jgi:23S rRNA pseudouridine955/2504/2580 synthase
MVSKCNDVINYAKYLVDGKQKDYALSRLDRYIRRTYGRAVPQSAIEKALRHGDVLLNGKKAQASDAVSATDSLQINDVAVMIFSRFGQNDDTLQNPLPLDAARRFSNMIIYEDEDIIMINKPSGLAVQLGSKMRCAVDIMAKAYNRNARLVHRIDKDTSGVVILSKNVETSRYMLDLFQHKAVKKKYIATVDGTLPCAQLRISKPLLKRGGNVFIDYNSGKEAITEFRIIRTIEQSITMLEVTPITGRTHQIRVHLASINCPIIGDKRYGGTAHNSLCLHSYEVSFISRSGRVVKQTAEIPECIVPERDGVD